MMSKQFKHCPLCAGNNIVMDHDAYVNWYIICDDCGCEINANPQYPTLDALIRLWENRPLPNEV